MRRQSSSTHWQSDGFFPSLAVQADYGKCSFPNSCISGNIRLGTRLSVMTPTAVPYTFNSFTVTVSDAYRRDCYLNANNTSSVCSNYYFAGSGAVTEDGRRRPVFRSMVRAPSDIVITHPVESKFSMVFSQKDWETVSSHIVKQDGHRVKDEGAIVRRGRHDL